MHGHAYQHTLRVVGEQEAELIVLDGGVFKQLIQEAGTTQEQIAAMLQEQFLEEEEQSAPTLPKTLPKTLQKTLQQTLLATFPGVTPDLLQMAEDHTRTELYQPKELVIQQGDLAQQFYILLQGAVEVFQDFDSRSPKLLRRMEQGESFGELGLLQGGTRTATVRAAEDSSAQVIAIDDVFFRLLFENSTCNGTDLALNLHEKIVTSYFAQNLPNVEMSDLTDVLLKTTISAYAPNTELIKQGETIKRFCVIAEGRLECWHLTSENNPELQQVLEVGQCFGEGQIMNGDPSPVTIRSSAQTKVSLMWISRQVFSDLVLLSRTSPEQVATVITYWLTDNIELSNG